MIKNPNLAGIVTIIIWSLTALLIHFSGNIPPFESVAFIYFFSFLTFFSRWVITGDCVKAHFKLPKKTYLIVTCGFTGYTCLYYFALKMAPILPANLLNYIWPIALTLFLCFADRKKISIIVIVGLILGLLGTYFILLTKSSVQAEYPYAFIGYIAAFVAAFLWAGYSTLTRKIFLPSDSLPVFYLITAVCGLVLHLLMEDFVYPTTQEMLAMACLGLSSISYIFWDYSMKKGNAHMIASLSYLIPLFSSLSLVIFVTQDLNIYLILGGALILTGALLANYQRWKSRELANM